MSIIIGSKNSNDISEKTFSPPHSCWENIATFLEFLHSFSWIRFKTWRKVSWWRECSMFSAMVADSRPRLHGISIPNNYFNLKNIIRAPWLVRNLPFHNRIVCENWKMIIFRISFHIFIFARSVVRELSCNYELSSTGVIVSWFWRCARSDGSKNGAYLAIITSLDCSRDAKFHNGGLVFCPCHPVSDKRGNTFYFLPIEETRLLILIRVVKIIIIEWFQQRRGFTTEFGSAWAIILLTIIQ